MLTYKKQVLYNLYEFHLFFLFIIKIILVTQMEYNFTFSLKKMQSSGKKKTNTTEL